MIEAWSYEFSSNGMAKSMPKYIDEFPNGGTVDRLDIPHVVYTNDDKRFGKKVNVLLAEDNEKLAKTIAKLHVLYEAMDWMDLYSDISEIVLD